MPVFYFLLFVAAIKYFSFFQDKKLKSYVFPLFFLLKIIAGIGLVFIYTFYYTDRKTADIFKLFDDSMLLFNVYSQSPSDFLKLLFGLDTSNSLLLKHTVHMNFWNNSNPNELYNDSRLMIKINALLRFVSFGYYGVHLVFFSFFSFVGLVGFYKAFQRFYELKITTLFVLFLVPSFVLWTSGILKESVLILSLGLFMFSFFELIHFQFNLKKGIVFFLTFLLLIFIKPYVIAFVFPALLCYWLANKFKSLKVSMIYLGVYGVLLISVISIGFIFPTYNLLGIIATKQNNFINVARGGIYLHDGTKEVYVADSNRSCLTMLNDTLCKINPASSYSYRMSGAKKNIAVTKSKIDETVYRITFDAPPSGSLLKIEKLDPNLISFSKALPFAFINVMFRPLLFSSSNILLIMSSIENILLLFFFIIVLIYKKKYSLINQNLFWFCLAVAFSILIFVGLTTPVLGAIVRYKIPGLVFLLFGLICILDIKKISLFKQFKW